MADHATGDDEAESLDESRLQVHEDPRESVEAYETEDGVVLYDARNPLAWLKATNAISLENRI